VCSFYPFSPQLFETRDFCQQQASRQSSSQQNAPGLSVCNTEVPAQLLHATSGPLDTVRCQNELCVQFLMVLGESAQKPASWVQHTDVLRVAYRLKRWLYFSSNVIKRAGWNSSAELFERVQPRAERWCGNTQQLESPETHHAQRSCGCPITLSL